jgi:hypothetical protein
MIQQYCVDTKISNTPDYDIYYLYDYVLLHDVNILDKSK